MITTIYDPSKSKEERDKRQLIRIISFLGGWVTGFKSATYLTELPGVIYFSHEPLHHWRGLEEKEHELIATVEDADIDVLKVSVSVSFDQYQKQMTEFGYAVKIRLGQKLTHASSSFKHPTNLPRLAPFFWGPASTVLPSVQVICRIENSFKYHTAYYCYSENRWVVDMDFNFGGKVIAWWDMPPDGTGINPN